MSAEKRGKILFSGVCAALLLFRYFFPSALPTDTISVGLVLFALLPWASAFVKSAEIGGWKLEFQELQKEVARQQSLINDLVEYSVSASIFVHLCGIALLKEYKYVDSEANRREFYFLRDSGLIQPRSNRAFLDFGPSLNGCNIVDIADVTPIGRFAVKLRATDVPPNMLSDARNLRVSLKELSS